LRRHPIPFSSRLALHAVALCLLASVPAHAADEGPRWVPPKSDKWDWIRLTSGEWLKGELKALRDREIAFDSDNLDDLDIDLDDVDRMYFNRLSYIRTEDGTDVQGTGVLRGDVLTFETVDGQTLEIARKDIVTIVPGGKREIDYWSFKANASYALQDGNTDQVDLSGMVGIYRDTATLRFQNEYRGIWGSQDNSTVTNNHRATTTLDVYLTSRFFLRVPSVEYYKDEFKNLAHRVSPGAGVGYELIRNSWVEFDLSVGSVYQFSETEDGETSHDFAGTFGSELNFDLPRGLELDNSYSLQLVATDLAKTSHHFESVLSLDVWGPLDLDLTFILDRIERPEKDGDDRPDSNDVSIMAGFSLEF